MTAKTTARTPKATPTPMPALAPVDNPTAVVAASDELEAALLVVFVPVVLLVLAAVILVLLAEDVVVVFFEDVVPFAAAQNSMYHADTSIRSDASVQVSSQVASGLEYRGARNAV